MRLSELLSPSRIRIPLTATDKEGVLRELVELLVTGNGAGGGGGGGGGGENTRDDVLEAILERERQFPTGIGYGVVAGTTPAPVPYETVDGEPVRLFFLLAGPESCAGAHVKVLSRISRLVRREPIRGRLLGARSPEEFYTVLCEAEVP